MGREASTAPKERINVTFKPATGGAVEEIELPMKVAILGDFRQAHDERSLLDRKPVAVNRNNFADVMEKQNLTLNMAVRNRLQDGEEKDLQANLRIASIRDFEPGSIIDQVPELKKVIELRQALVTLKGPLGNLPAFRNKLEEIIQDVDNIPALLEELQNSGVDVSSIVGKGKRKRSNEGDDIQSASNGNDTKE